MGNWKICKRSAAALAVAALLMTPAAALFGKQNAAAPAAEGAPIAKTLEIHTYQGIAYCGEFLAADMEGGELTFAVVTPPKRGTVLVEGGTFTYTSEKGKSGADRFAYTATDEDGNVSAPAEVQVRIAKTKSAVHYADMGGHPAAVWAQQLAEEGVFTGGRIGSQYFFEPDRTITRSEFLAMTMVLTGKDAEEVTMTGFCDDEAIPVWAKAYAAAGLREGLVQGSRTEDGAAFRALDAVTVNEAAAILNRALSVGDVDLSVWYADRQAAPSWAAQAVGNMESVSVLAAGSFGSAELERCVTRADAAKMLCAAQTLLSGKDAGLLSWLG